jgi:dTDP-4-dehydrorhamnose reductase
VVKFVVLGAAGQLGRDLCPRLPGEVAALTRDQADLTQPEMLRGALSGLRPDLVINCAAYNLVDRAEIEPHAAFAVNAWGARALARICHELNCVLIHISTNYVFGMEQDRTTPYEETDAPGPISVYGLSKLAGEYCVRSLCRDHLIIRTCGLFGVWGSGGKGGNFVETMLGLAQQKKQIRVVADQVCTPSYTVDVAEAVARLAAEGCRGIYHVTNSGSCSWHEFATAIFELADVKANVVAVTSQEFGASAPRPAYSVLASRLPPLRPWRDALAAYLQERVRKKSNHTATEDTEKKNTEKE